MSLLRERVTIVWILLMSATCISTWLLPANTFSAEVAVVAIFALAAFKVRYVLLDFMELRSAPVAARVFFEGWIALVTVVILGFWFAAPSPN
ncbi:MAG: cytochrome C oxidase subunit IV family protein [Sporichthyaceae bacterium]